MKKPNLKLLFTCASLFVLCSCNEIKSLTYLGQVPNWTFSINEIIKYPRANSGEKKIQSFDGRSIWVRRAYELCSREIEDIEAVPMPDKPGYYNLKVKLDEHGSIAAMRLCNDLSHAPWAFVMNGMFYRTVSFQNAALDKDYKEILIQGPFEKTVAENLAEFANKNYVYYHKND